MVTEFKKLASQHGSDNYRGGFANRCAGGRFRRWISGHGDESLDEKQEKVPVISPGRTGQKSSEDSTDQNARNKRETMRPTTGVLNIPLSKFYARMVRLGINVRFLMNTESRAKAPYGIPKE